ncbi:MAG: DUF362 domain-containing protein [Deltaproteobacteria bacterium]|nr:DUF362 domain-containing protein [Deltaproteobacteria bacterium]
MIRESLDRLGNLDDLIAPGKKVLIKPNVAENYCIRADVTDVRVTRALAKITKEKGAQVIIAESGSVAQDTEKLFDMCGYLDLRREGYELGVATMNPEQIEVVGRSIQEVSKKFVLPTDRMQRLSEDLGINIIMDEKTCTGCQTTIFSTIGTIVDMGKGDALKGLTLISGMDLEVLPDVPKDKLVLIGNCTAKFKDQGRYVEGCPIWANEMLYEITGEMVPETFMGDFLDQGYEIYRKKVAQGMPEGFSWDSQPDEREMKRYIS